MSFDSVGFVGYSAFSAALFGYVYWVETKAIKRGKVRSYTPATFRTFLVCGWVANEFLLVGGSASDAPVATGVVYGFGFAIWFTMIAIVLVWRRRQPNRPLGKDERRIRFRPQARRYAIGFGAATPLVAGVVIYQFVYGHVAAGLVCLAGFLAFAAMAVFFWRFSRG